MAVNNSITAERFNEIKEKVKKLCQQRNVTMMGGELTEYATSEWDYTEDPTQLDDIKDEHVRKIVDPLLQVNDFLGDNSIRNEKSGLSMPIEKAEDLMAENQIKRIPVCDSNNNIVGMLSIGNLFQNHQNLDEDELCYTIECICKNSNKNA